MASDIKYTTSGRDKQTIANVNTITFDTVEGGTAEFHDTNYADDSTLTSGNQLLQSITAYGRGEVKYTGTITNYAGGVGSLVVIPTLVSSSIAYTGQAITPSFNNLDSTKVTVGGTTSATVAGTYQMTLSLINATDYWADGTKEVKTITWSISVRVLTIPTANPLTYNKTSQTASLANFDSTYMTMGGTTTATVVGNYTATVTLKDTVNTKWSDSTTAMKTVGWSISRRSLTVPTANKSIYTGSAVSISLNYYDSTYMTLGGTTSATAVGTYTATVSLQDTSNTQWADSTTETKNISWQIVAQSYSVSTSGHSSYGFDLDTSINPDTTLYDGVYKSNNYNINSSYAVAKITFYGYTTFTVYIRSYAESNYDYTVASVIDASSYPTSSSGAQASTYGNQKGGTAISNYTAVSYSTDGGEHHIYITYRKDGSVHSNEDRGFFIIPK